MRKNRLGLSLALIVAGSAIFVGAISIVPQMRYAIRADIAWENVGAPEALHQRAYRYFPLTYPVLERYARSTDTSRAAYAVDSFAHFGGFAARVWFARALQQNIPLDEDAAQGLRNLQPFGIVTANDQAALAAKAVHVGLTQSDSERTHIAQLLLEDLGPAALPALEFAARGADANTLVKLADLIPEPDIHFSAAERARVAALRRICAPALTAAENITRTKRSLSDLASEQLTRGHNSALKALRRLVAGNLRVFNTISYGPDMIAVAKAFPKSRLNRGFLAYDAIRGGTYFGRDTNDDNRTDKALAHPANWRTWLDLYSDHPGADDASYWLGRSLARSGHRVGALRAYLEAVEHSLGDGDMRDIIIRRALWMLDVGATDEDLSEYVRIYPQTPLAPLVEYAAAVRAARSHDYNRALKLAAALTPPGSERALRLGFGNTPETVSALIEVQRSYWVALAGASDAAQERAWASDDGWKIGYFAFYDGTRMGGAAYAGEPGLDSAALSANMQSANRNAQIIAFTAEEPLHDSDDSFRLQHELRISALYSQLADYPDNETAAMGFLPSLPAEIGSDTRLFRPALNTDENAEDDVAARNMTTWWTRQLVAQVRDYVHDYKQAPFCADALLAAYEVTGETTYLRQLLALSAAGPRSEEARALLWRATNRPQM